MSQSPSPVSPHTDSEHLSFPIFDEDARPEASTSYAPQPRRLLQDRLYIGNLHPTVDEYSLLQLFSKFGKVTKLDFLFHKAGVLKGKPRGYAFIEYGSNDEAAKALTLAHDKLFRGRKLVVTFAHQAPIDPNTGSAIKRRGMTESGRPTTLSLLKSSLSSRQGRTDDKIAMMEAKLRQMDASKPGSAGSNTGLAALPAKPPPPLPPHLADTLATHSAQRRPQRSGPLPSLPLAAPLAAPQASPSLSSSGGSVQNKPKISAPRPGKSKLLGVKMKKPKEKVPSLVEDGEAAVEQP